ncbi:hydroxyisourate hydrolase [Paenibacillus radicis (ex Xue et al. 2023)]|uniref:5-hydroxyisourate hydrolase n=1 Tax=Paenibacillus radicis (ex Xue et al. 2023) TaxID=2972489 RepID=A0ABT1YJG6_9BACL|nr:hydroxyisourate hydrolase [Paenibacillus radicis (ex Xue et al. 2023)]MCR8633321.1 hydroxyisourate hydrolase [Paenibacillus radicis (ex Xue et al. 2023)]
MSGRLTTHVLELSAGRPAQGMRVALFYFSQGGAAVELQEAVTNSDGRLDGPLLSGEGMVAGSYELLFYVGDYYRNKGIGAGQATESPMFLEEVPIRFQISNVEQHYHVPLLVAPGGYSTYRGS